MKEKNICIISSYAYIRNNNNYGALLQYFALENYLTQRGHAVYWLRYAIDKGELHYIGHLIKIYKNIFFVLKNYLCHKSFLKFTHKKINISKKVYKSYEHLERENPQADYYITGSDQVWGGVLKANYLQFISDNNKKIAYAVSFGRKELTEEQKQIGVIQWIKDFSAVSVREKDGIDICNKINVKAEHLLDPTLLIDKTVFSSVIKKNKIAKKNIYCYFMNVIQLKDIYWNDIINFTSTFKKELKITAVGLSGMLFPKEYLVYPSPEDWIQAYSNAEYIITNTFHGMVFAIIFQKPFAVILQNGQFSSQNCRFLSLLETLDLCDHIWTNNNSLYDVLNKQIDWDKISTIINTLRLKSDSFFTSFDL